MSPRPASRRAVTVADIARAAKVSKATAARALGDYGQVSEAVRARVQAAAEELNYRPNALAKSMNTGRSNTIGVVVGDIENPFFAHAMRGISDVANKAGYDVILINSDEDVDAEEAAVDVLLDKQVDALIVAPASSARVAHLEAVGAAGRPLVLLDRRADGQRYDSVTVDNRTAAAHATAELLAEGHRRIAFISTHDHQSPVYTPGDTITMSSVADRIDGVMEALTDAGVPSPERNIRLDARRRGVDAVARELLTGDDPVTAIIASDSLIAMTVFQTIRTLGLRIPDDVSLIAFDNPEWTGITTPPLTVVEQPIYELGAAAARLALQRMRGERVDDEAVVFDADLVRRSSVGPVPAQVPLIAP
ncbi:LacI family DNA-binding transcriptional regulator [Leifsonia sp. RAF41]|uniref:LacI family DNA-binding transcriptional regulator n=1 Tax=Leifsonia sp. RAF41 TaxID=3233056 RepID=UPI003F98C21E